MLTLKHSNLNLVKKRTLKVFVRKKNFGKKKKKEKEIKKLSKSESVKLD